MERNNSVGTGTASPAVCEDQDQPDLTGTYEAPSRVHREVPDGFDNLWTEVYYAEENYKQFGNMRCFVSDDDTSWKSRTGPERSLSERIVAPTALGTGS
jgi:hypothetical protein